jgi:hypothetical protein
MSANEAERHLRLEQQPFGDEVREAMRRRTDKWWSFVAVGVAWLIVSASSVVVRPELRSGRRLGRVPQSPACSVAAHPIALERVCFDRRQDLLRLQGPSRIRRLPGHGRPSWAFRPEAGGLDKRPALS